MFSTRQDDGIWAGVPTSASSCPSCPQLMRCDWGDWFTARLFFFYLFRNRKQSRVGEMSHPTGYHQVFLAGKHPWQAELPPTPSVLRITAACDPASRDRSTFSTPLTPPRLRFAEVSGLSVPDPNSGVAQTHPGGCSM